MQRRPSDIVFFLVIVAIPTSLFALVSEQAFYIPGVSDLSMVSWLIALPYFFLYRKNLRSVIRLPAGAFLVIVIVYIAFSFLSTIYGETPWQEAFTVFRYYFSPIACLGLLLYVLEMDANRIDRFLKWVVVAMTIQGFFFVFRYLTGLSVFSTSVHLDENAQGATLERFFLAFPMFNQIVFLFSIINVIVRRRLIWLTPLFLSSFSVLLVSTRSVVFVYVLMMVVVMLYVFRKRGVAFLPTFLGFSIFVAIGLLIYRLLFPAYFSFLNERFGEALSSGDVRQAGTYEYRLALILVAVSENVDNGTAFFGAGYKRLDLPAIDSDFELAMSGDTNVAPVLYTEGIVGLVIRVLPLIILLLRNVKDVFGATDERVALLSLCSLALIVPEIPNFIQTTAFRYYTGIVFFVFLFEIMKVRLGSTTTSRKMLFL